MSMAKLNQSKRWPAAVAACAFVLWLATPGSALAAPTSPSVDETYTSGVSAEAATLNAEIDPHGANTTYRFEYGATTAYGASVPAGEASVGSGTSDVLVSQHIAGLTAGNVYHYRAVAKNEDGETVGSDHTFVFQSAVPSGEGCTNASPRTGYAAHLPDCRAYEQVSPPQLEPLIGVGAELGNLLGPGVGVRGESAGGLEASAAGERLLFFSPYGFPGEGGGGGFFALASRGAAGWSAEDPVPPQSVTNNTAGCGNAYFPLATRELTNWVFADGFGQGERKEGLNGEAIQDEHCATDEPALVGGEPQGFQNLFLHDSGAGVDPGSWQLIDTPASAPEGAKVNDAWAQGASEDLSTVVFTEAAQLTPEAPTITPPKQGGPSKDWSEDLYVWSGGVVRLVTVLTVLPDGHAVAGALANGNVPHLVEPGRGTATFTHAVSSDADRVAFEAEGNVYVRENPQQPPEQECSSAQAACTVQLDAGQGVSASGGGHFGWASSDGARVFFSDERDLVAGAHASAGRPDLYEYDFERREGERLQDITAGAEAADVQGVAGVSEDGSIAYFVAGGDLTGTKQNSQGVSAIGPAHGSGELKGGGEGTGEATLGSDELTDVKVTRGEFFVGQEVEGGFIPGHTTITGCSPSCSAPQELTLSSSANNGQVGSEHLIGYGHNQITGVSTTSGSFAAGMTVSGSGIRPGTRIVAIGAGTITLSQGVATEASGTQTLSANADNLYMHRGEETAFIATLTSSDSDDWTSSPKYITARVSPDGNFIAFDSLGQLTGYDNRGPCEGQTLEVGACQEIFLYEVEQNKLSCASCAPSGELPGGPARIEPPMQIGQINPDRVTYLPRFLSDSGQVFFNTVARLLPADENDLSNVYEYENGQLHLLSPGSTSANAYFVEASANGEDVFLVTSELLGDKNGDLAIFDARVDGGFPEPVASVPCGEGDCSTASGGALPGPPPGSATFTGPGNPPLSPSTIGVKASKTGKPSRAQELSRALKACRAKRNKLKRKSCVRHARKEFGQSKKAKK